MGRTAVLQSGVGADLAHWRSMRVRITGETDEIDVFVAWLHEHGAVVSDSQRRYPNRSGLGERAYLTVELPTQQQE